MPASPVTRDPAALNSLLLPSGTPPGSSQPQKSIKQKQGRRFDVDATSENEGIKIPLHSLQDGPPLFKNKVAIDYMDQPRSGGLAK